MTLDLDTAADVLTDLQLRNDVPQDVAEPDELGAPNPPTTKEIIPHVEPPQEAERTTRPLA